MAHKPRSTQDPESLSVVQRPASSIVLTPSTKPGRSLLPMVLTKLLILLAGLFVFVLSLQLLHVGAGVYSSQIRNLLVTNVANALGLGWLLAYLFLSGSPVAAIAVSLFTSQTISNVQTLMMITGSRLGASFVVMFVGFLSYLRGHHRASSISIGVLALLTTAAIYLPALGIGYWMLTPNVLGMWQTDAAPEVSSFIQTIYSPILGQIESWPGWAIFLSGIGTLLIAFKLLDDALPEMDQEGVAFANISRLIYRPMAMFVLGALVTSVTLSVAVSLSMLVPLSIKGYIRREHVVPYILGANITTFIDTLVAALSAGGAKAFTIVFIEMVSVTIVSLLVLLLCYHPFEKAMLHVQARITHDNRSLTIFVVAILVVPFFLLMIR